jgi:hypothetical protein
MNRASPRNAESAQDQFAVHELTGNAHALSGSGLVGSVLRIRYRSLSRV